MIRPITTRTKTNAARSKREILILLGFSSSPDALPYGIIGGPTTQLAFAISSFLSLTLISNSKLSLSQSSSRTISEGRLRRYLKIGCPSYLYAVCFWSFTRFSILRTMKVWGHIIALWGHSRVGN